MASLLSPFVILLSILFLGESLQGWQLAGFALVMCGILLVTWRQNRREVDAAHLGKGVFYGVGGVFLMAVGVVMVKEILETRPFMATTTLRLAGGLSGMLIYMLLRARTGVVLQRFRQPLPWKFIVPASFLGRLCVDDDVACGVQADPGFRSLGAERNCERLDRLAGLADARRVDRLSKGGGHPADQCRRGHHAAGVAG